MPHDHRIQPEHLDLHIPANEFSLSRARTAPRHPHPGSSTAIGSNVAYRLGKLKGLGLLHGVWLDCGCADGGYTEALVAWGAEKAIGVDPEQSRIDEAKARNQTGSRAGRDAVEYHCCTDNFPLPDSSVDAALLNEVLEHVADEACHAARNSAGATARRSSRRDESESLVSIRGARHAASWP